jgi:hypothetical protein
MTDDERKKRERKLARQLSEVFGIHFEEMMDLLGDPPDYAKLDDEYWLRYQADLLRVLSPQLEQLFYDDFMAAAQRFGITFGVETGSADSLQFIRNYSFNLVKGITETTRKGIQDALSQFYEQGDFMLEDVAQKLYRFYSPVRAEMIAVTEITRASVEGERASGKELGDKYGLNIVDIWLTANDERVCPVCGPRHTVVISDGFYPPAHPRCRCGIRQEIRSADAD